MNLLSDGAKEVDLHVLIAPDKAWKSELRYADFKIMCTESTSAGFVRVCIDLPLTMLRGEVQRQLHSSLLPSDYSFLRRVAPKQESYLRTGNFAPPMAPSPEIYIIDSSCLSNSLTSLRNAYNYDIEEPSVAAKASRHIPKNFSQDTHPGTGASFSHPSHVAQHHHLQSHAHAHVPASSGYVYSPANVQLPGMSNKRDTWPVNLLPQPMPIGQIWWPGFHHQQLHFGVPTGLPYFTTLPPDALPHSVNLQHQYQQNRYPNEMYGDESKVQNAYSTDSVSDSNSDSLDSTTDLGAIQSPPIKVDLDLDDEEVMRATAMAHQALYGKRKQQDANEDSEPVSSAEDNCVRSCGASSDGSVFQSNSLQLSGPTDESRDSSNYDSVDSLGNETPCSERSRSVSNSTMRGATMSSSSDVTVHQSESNIISEENHNARPLSNIHDDLQVQIIMAGNERTPLTESPQAAIEDHVDHGSPIQVSETIGPTTGANPEHTGEDLLEKPHPESLSIAPRTNDHSNLSADQQAVIPDEQSSTKDEEISSAAEHTPDGVISSTADKQEPKVSLDEKISDADGQGIKAAPDELPSSQQSDLDDSTDQLTGKKDQSSIHNRAEQSSSSNTPLAADIDQQYYSPAASVEKWRNGSNKEVQDNTVLQTQSFDSRASNQEKITTYPNHRPIDTTTVTQSFGSTFNQPLQVLANTQSPVVIQQQLGVNIEFMEEQALSGRYTVKDLLAELQMLQNESQILSSSRNHLLTQMRALQSDLYTNRENAEKQWKRKYFHEKKLSSSMEEKIKQLKAEYYHRIQQNKVDEQLQFEFNKGLMPLLPISGGPSNHRNMKNECRWCEHKIQLLRQRMQVAREKLLKEQEVYKSSTTHCKIVKEDLTAKKIACTRTAPQTNKQDTT